jgi:hypothetical protein
MLGLRKRLRAYRNWEMLSHREYDLIEDLELACSLLEQLLKACQDLTRALEPFEKQGQVPILDFPEYALRKGKTAIAIVERDNDDQTP